MDVDGRGSSIDDAYLRFNATERLCRKGRLGRDKGIPRGRKKILCSWRGRGERVGVSVWRNNTILYLAMFSKKNTICKYLQQSLTVII